MGVRKFSSADEKHMRHALALAEKARGETSPNPLVGAVVVKGRKIIGEGYHQRAGMPHAEVIALAEAKEKARRATLYVNLEPCVHYGRTPPCVDAIVKAGLSRVVIATPDPNPLVNGQGIRLLRQAGIKVDCGLLQKEAERLNEFFFTYHQQQRPFVILKWAMSLDGRTSTDSGDSRWISNQASRQYVHQLRSQVDAILVGVETVIRDDPSLNIRLKGYRGRQPKRVILDYYLKIPLTARCVAKKNGGEAWVITSKETEVEKIRSLTKQGAKVICLSGRGGKIDLKRVMELFFREQILSVLVEGGRRVAGSFIRQKLVDKIVAFVAPKIIGGGKITSPLVDWGVKAISDSVQLKNIEIKIFNADVCIEGYLNQVG